MHTNHAGVSLIVSVKSTLPHKSVTYRSINKLSKLLNFFLSIAGNSTATYVYKRLLRALYKLNNPVYVFVRKFIYSCNFLGRLGRILAFGGRYIFGNIYKNRSGTTALCNSKCLSDSVSKFFDILIKIYAYFRYGFRRKRYTFLKKNS